MYYIKNLVAFFPSFVRFVGEAPARLPMCLSNFLSLQPPNVDKLCGILGKHLSIIGGVDDDVTAWRIDCAITPSDYVFLSSLPLQVIVVCMPRVRVYLPNSKFRVRDKKVPSLPEIQID